MPLNCEMILIYMYFTMSLSFWNIICVQDGCNRLAILALFSHNAHVHLHTYSF